MPLATDADAPALEPIDGWQGIYQRLRERILHWHYPPGYHLGEQALCKEFSISRIPVREALGVLTAEGFVDKIPNQGCFVKQLNVKETQEWFELRLALELHVGEQLTVTPPAKEWMLEQRTFWSGLLEPKDADLDVTRFVAADNAFHLGLAAGCGNERIRRILVEVIDRLRFTKLAVETTVERLQETATEHLAILSAIEHQDVAAVRATLRQNIEHASSRVELAISRALLAAHNKS